jgi:hypothetical protein
MIILRRLWYTLFCVIEVFGAQTNVQFISCPNHESVQDGLEATPGDYVIQTLVIFVPFSKI